VLLDHQGLYPRLTARENISYFGRLQGVPHSVLISRIDRLISLLALERLGRRRTAGFSQGERVKVALARAIVHEPQNLVLDEVTNGLDVPTVHSLRELLRGLRDQGRCVLFSSHVLEDVRSLCDHIVFIASGRVIAAGTAQTLCAEAGAATLEQAFLRLISSGGRASCQTL
jgi:sodium transport system ATP-binding protein